MEKKFIVLCIFIILNTISIKAQNSEWVKYGRGNVVTSIAMEGDYIFAGTGIGVAKINMKTHEVQFPELNYGLQSSLITKLAIDKNGNKWFSSILGGLAKYSGTNIESFTISLDLVQNPNFSTPCIAVDTCGNTWIAAHQILKFDGKNFTQYTSSITGISEDINALLADKKGNLWFGTNSYLYKYDGKTWVKYNILNKSVNIQSIAEDKNGNLWIGIKGYAESACLIKYNGTNFTEYTPPASIYNTSTIAIDSAGNKWLGCDNNLWMFDGQHWTNCDTTNSGIDIITSILIDSNGNKWIGTINGLLKYNGTTWEKINIAKSYFMNTDSFFTGYEIAIDKYGNKWFCGKNIVTEFDGNNWVEYTPSNSGLQHGESSYIIAVDKNNIKWFGTYEGGLSSFDGTIWHYYNTQNSGIPSNDINSITIDSLNNKWIGTENGLVKFDGVNWITFNKANSQIPHNRVYSVAIDLYGNKWIGTVDGLAKFDGINWTVFNESNSQIPSNMVFTLKIDNKNNIWLNTLSKGIAKYDGTNWTSFNTTNSQIPSDTVNSMVIDSKNNIWICGLISGFGIAKFNGTTWQIYNTANSGIPSNFISSIIIDSLDDKWLGTLCDGICEFTGGKEDANGNLISGNIVYNNSSNSPITNCKVYLIKNSTVIDSTNSAADGSFKFNSVQNGSYSIKLGNMPAWGGVNSTDALWLRQFVIGARSFDSLQIKASDVNLSGSVNSTDALLIRQRTVNLINSFPVADWVYYSPFVTINNANANVTIKTLCAGDLNNSYVPSGAKRTAAVMLADNGQIKPAMASEFELPVTVNKSMSISGLTLLFDYNSKYFDVVGIKSKIEGLTYSINNGKIKIAWDDLSPISFNEGDNIISLILKAVNKNKSQNCDFQLTLNGESELADANGNSIGNVVLSVPSLSDNIVKDYQLMQNYPNPFNPSTTIKYALPVDSYVDMAVYNVLGQKVKTLINGIKAMGSYDVKFEAGNLPSGIYFYSLDAKAINESRNYHQVYKLIIMK